MSSASECNGAPAPEKVDVLICGSGSAGLCAATWLARYGVSCTVLESRAGPMKVGQADGVQVRTVEIFESFGMVEELLREAYHVLEDVFWSPDGDKGIKRDRSGPDTAPGLSHLPHVILNQARINGLMLEAMDRFNGQKVEYGYAVTDVKVDSTTSKDPQSHCVTVTAEKDGVLKIYQAKYALGCDGAHSAVRRSLGFKMIGDTSDSVWGVMDIFPRTDFPDIRKKAVVFSNSGTVIIIPREGDSMVRFYVQLPHGTDAKQVTQQQLTDTASRIFSPYTVDIAHIHWWSAYSIGQRLADHFTADDRVFLTGDACHTHSPKAGQGMNTSLQDGYNLGWKLAGVLKGQYKPEILETYRLERAKVAANLIAFDREWAKAIGDKSATSRFSETFANAAKYTAGLTHTYDDSSLTCAKYSKQSLAKNTIIGTRVSTAQVVRFSDARAMQLVKVLPADGRWRIVIFGGDIRKAAQAQRLRKLAEYLESDIGPIRKHTPANADIDNVIEKILVLSGKRLEVKQTDIPDCFWPVSGPYKMRDLHKIFFDDESYNSGHGKAYEAYGVEPEQGAVVVVRPDHHISMVTDIDERERLGKFFEGFATVQAQTMTCV